jgi:glycerophosphoryl diester phosphodiesterase
MKFIAHRGCHSHCAENTLPAFKAVIDHPQNGKNLIGIELDIHATRDSRIIVMHNTNIEDERGRSVAVADITYEQLKKFAALKNSGESAAIPDIDETLRLVNHNTELCFEIKQAAYDLERFTARFIDSLEQYNPANDVVISSFSHEIIRRVAAAAGHLNVKFAFVFRTWDSLETLPESVTATLSYLHPSYKLLLNDPAKLFACSLPLQCWTVNKPADIESILNLPIAGNIRSIMTDNVEFSQHYGES